MIDRQFNTDQVIINTTLTTENNQNQLNISSLHAEKHISQTQNIDNQEPYVTNQLTQFSKEQILITKIPSLNQPVSAKFQTSNQLIQAQSIISSVEKAQQSDIVNYYHQVVQAVKPAQPEPNHEQSLLLKPPQLPVYYLPSISHSTKQKLLKDKISFTMHKNSPLGNKFRHCDPAYSAKLIDSVLDELIHDSFCAYFNTVSVLTKSQIEEFVQTRQRIDFLE
eukprot:EST47499.1 Hypothetical protein SS50377_12484 [Spironucleus salmonicida]